MGNAVVSFIIPHRGRCELLLATLASLAALETDDTRIEIIVVTQEAGLDSAELARWIGQQGQRVGNYPDVAPIRDSMVDTPNENDAILALRVLKSPPTATISALRNCGAAVSSGYYLAFLDADIELSSNWLTAMRATLAARSTRVIVSAVQANPPQPKPLERVRVALSNMTVDANLQFLPGRNLFLERKTFDAIGGFPEHLATCEDYWFTDKAGQIGELYYSSAASYVHLGEDKAYLEMARKEIWRGQSNLHSVSGRRISLRESASFFVPFWVLGAVVTLIPATIVFGILAFAVLATAIILPLGLYSWRVLHASVQKLPIGAVLGFYLLYLSARGLGMLMGVVKALVNIARQKASSDERANK